MRNTSKYIFGVAVGCFAMVWLNGCASTKLRYVEPENFIEVSRHASGGSCKVTYLGTSDNRIYCEFMNVIDWNSFLSRSKKTTYTVYWTDLDEVPQEVVKELESKRTK
jgi:hypothetical protein